MKTLPRVMSSRPAIMRSAVDLPHPEGPTKTTNSPSGMSRFISWTATTSSPKTLVTFSMVTSATLRTSSFSGLPNASIRLAPVPGSPPYSFFCSILPQCTSMRSPAVERVAIFDVFDTFNGGVNLLSRHLAGPHRCHDGLVGRGLFLGTARDQEQLSTGLYRLDRRPRRRPLAPRPLHRQVVRDDYALETELSAQHLYRRRREARGPFGIYRRVDEVAQHHCRHPGLDGCLKRRQVALQNRLPVMIHDRAGDVRVFEGGAVVREVFRRGDDARPLEALDRRGAH